LLADPAFPATDPTSDQSSAISTNDTGRCALKPSPALLAGGKLPFGGHDLIARGGMIVRRRDRWPTCRIAAPPYGPEDIAAAARGTRRTVRAAASAALTTLRHGLVRSKEQRTALYGGPIIGFRLDCGPRRYRVRAGGALRQFTKTSMRLPSCRAHRWPTARAASLAPLPLRWRKLRAELYRPPPSLGSQVSLQLARTRR